jgi:hypothetical protein
MNKLRKNRKHLPAIGKPHAKVNIKGKKHGAKHSPTAY